MKYVKMDALVFLLISIVACGKYMYNIVIVLIYKIILYS